MPAPLLTFSTGSLYLYGLERCFALAAELGFDGVEVLCDERLDTRQPDYLCRLSERHALPITSLHAPFMGRTMAGWEPGAIRGIEQTVALAETLGAAHIVMHLPERLGLASLQTRKHRIKLPWLPASAPIKAWMDRGGLARLQAGTLMGSQDVRLPDQVVAVDDEVHVR
jgi:sugar phosphate isomerase/epimerase